MYTKFRFWLHHGGYGHFRMYLFFLVLLLSTGLMWSCAHKKYRTQEIQCLAMNIYHEARGEPLEGRQAVAIVTMNRMSSSDFPDNVCQVVYQRNLRHTRYFGEFSWTQDILTDIPWESASWREALELAGFVYEQYPLLDNMNEAIYYHTTAINPYWARHKIRLAQIGNHIFYR